MPVLLSILSFSIFACAHQPNVRKAASEADPQIITSTQDNCDLPTLQKNHVSSIFIKHRAMLINYNPILRAPNWVFHELYRDNVERSCSKRPGANSFQEDHDLDVLLKGLGASSVSILDEKSYKNSGYDRGHLAPNADFSWDAQAQKESFVMTNMMPQQPQVNRMVWGKLEDRLRRFACGMGQVKVYTGPIYAPQNHREMDPPSKIEKLPSCAAIPKAYYKALMSYKDGKYYGIAFIYSQNDHEGSNLTKQQSKTDISNERAVTIAEVEKQTGIPLFTEFADDIQKEFKNQLRLSDWIDSDDCYRKLCSPERGQKNQSDDMND